MTVEELTLLILNFKLKYVIPVLILITAISFAPEFYINILKQDNKIEINITNTNISNETVLKYKFYGVKSEVHLKSLTTVLNRMGFKKEHNNASTDWDLLWSHIYPFNDELLKSELKLATYHQRINHFPGNYFLTHKGTLSTSQYNFSFMLPSFKIPSQIEELLNYAVEHPNKTFVKKNVAHGNVRIINLDEYTFKEQNMFIQEFMDKPFLIDGYKFEITVYTLITSMDPLRIYAYYGDIPVK